MHFASDKIQHIPIDSLVNTEILKEGSPERGQVPSGKEFGDELQFFMDPANESVAVKTEKQSAAPEQHELKKSFSFRDVIDVINPLQHIPIISTVYRNITHDEIKAPARILGGGLFGGVIGAVSGLINAISTKITGKDIGEHAFNLFQESDDIHAQEKVALKTFTSDEKFSHDSIHAPLFTQEVALKAIERYEIVNNLNDPDDRHMEDVQNLNLFY